MLGPVRIPAFLVEYHHRISAKEGQMTPNIDEIIRDHVTLSIRCHRSSVPAAVRAQAPDSGGLSYFLHDHLGYPIPSPALFRLCTTASSGRSRPSPPPRRPPDRASNPVTIRTRSSARYRARFTARRRRRADRSRPRESARFKAQKRATPTGSVTFDFSQRLGVREPLLLLRPGSRVGPGLREGGDLPPLSSQPVSQRA